MVANSTAVARTIPTARTVTIYNGIDLRAFRPGVEPLDGQKDLELPPGAQAIGTVGHLAPIKGLETLIEAAFLVRDRLPRAHFLIAGGAIYETHRRYARRLEELVRRRGLEERVHFLGFFSEVPRLLATLDLFVLPSRSEGFGRALAEAMAVGCPVIAAAVGGVPEVVRHGVDGLLVPPGDPRALAESIVRLMGDASLRNRLAEQGERRVREHFSLPRQALRFRTAVLSALSG